MIIAITRGLMLTCVAGMAQGTILFQNVGPGLDAPIRMPDGTPVPAGNNFVAELLAGASPESLRAFNPPIQITTWVGSGWFGVGQPEKVLPGFAPGSRPWFQVRIYNNPGFCFWGCPPPTIYGVSTVFQLGALGGLGNPAAAPPIPAPPLNGMEGIGLVPEPALMALVVAGGAALFFGRRK